MTASPLRAVSSAHLRIARPTDRLEDVVAFYKSVLGFLELGRFTDHDGCDGVMLGHPGLGYHLEFTHAQGHHIGNARTQDNLLVFYISPVDFDKVRDTPDEQEFVKRLSAAFTQAFSRSGLRFVEFATGRV